MRFKPTRSESEVGFTPIRWFELRTAFTRQKFVDGLLPLSEHRFSGAVETLLIGGRARVKLRHDIP